MEKEIYETLHLMVLHLNEEIADCASVLVYELMEKNAEEVEFMFYDEKFIVKTISLLEKKTISLQVI
jgi:hypothetical protein